MRGCVSPKSFAFNHFVCPGDRKCRASTLSLKPEHLGERMRPHRARARQGTPLVLWAQDAFALFSDKRHHHSHRGPLGTLRLLPRGSTWTPGSPARSHLIVSRNR